MEMSGYLALNGQDLDKFIKWTLDL
jgi:hypothetical protein